MKGLKIVSTGRYVPRRVVTNEEMCTIVDTSDEWIVSRSGIRERHYVENETGLDLSREAAKIAIARAGIDPKEIACCIVPTSSADYLSPATGSLLQAELSLSENTACFDLSAGCTGFVYGLHMARSLLLDAKRPYALLVGTDVLSRITNFEDRGTCVLFGDGAGAVILKLEEDAPYACELYARSNAEALNIPGPGHGKPESLIAMQGQEVFKFAIKAMPESVEAVLADAGLTLAELDWIIPHQANRRIIESAAKRLKFPLEKCYMNMERYGNTSAASIPIVLDEMAEAGLLQKGQKLVCTGFGAGLTWGAVLLEW